MAPDENGQRVRQVMASHHRSDSPRSKSRKPDTLTPLLQGTGILELGVKAMECLIKKTTNKQKSQKRTAFQSSCFEEFFEESFSWVLRRSFGISSSIIHPAA